MLTESSILSGSDFQTLAEVSYCTINKLQQLPIDSFPKHPIVVDTDPDSSSILSVFNGSPDQLCGVTRIFCYGDSVESFHKKGIRLFGSNLKIIVHNSDEEFSIDYLPLVESNQIRALYAQNVTFYHPKLTGIPIGLANPWWKHGKREFAKILNEKSEYINNKKRRLYVNFSTTTHPVRQYYRNVLIENGFDVRDLDSHLTQHQYIDRILESTHVFCPRGNGYDTHRFWEALYCGANPVLFESDLIPVHKHFRPVVLRDITDLVKLSKDLLDQPSTIAIKTCNDERLTSSYWRKAILAN